MYGLGNGITPTVLAAATVPVSIAVLPRTGMHTALQIAIAVAVSLVCWALAYMVKAKFSKH